MVSLVLLKRVDDVFVGLPTGMVVWVEEVLEAKKNNQIL
jgi:hypothetical protein